VSLVVGEFLLEGRRFVLKLGSLPSDFGDPAALFGGLKIGQADFFVIGMRGHCGPFNETALWPQFGQMV
jgi:hypothetical protein